MPKQLFQKVAHGGNKKNIRKDRVHKKMTIEEGPGEKLMIGPFTAEWSNEHDCFVTDCGQHIDLFTNTKTKAITVHFKRMMILKDESLNKNLRDFLGEKEYQAEKKKVDKIMDNVDKRIKTIGIIADLD
jgi:hypothetical protein